MQIETELSGQVKQFQYLGRVVKAHAMCGAWTVSKKIYLNRKQILLRLHKPVEMPPHQMQKTCLKSTIRD